MRSLRAQRLAREFLRIRKAFKNWPVVTIAGVLWKYLPLPRRDLVVTGSAGTRIVVPLTRDAGALYPVLDIFAFSAYGCSWRLEDAPYVVDIGANIGAFMLWMAETYPHLRGTCFEPDPDAFAYLRKNVAHLDVVPRCEAVSDRCGSAVLTRPSPCGGTSSLHLATTGRGNGGIEVPVVAFKDVFGTLDDAVALVKMDCEGSEYEIVHGSPPESWRAVRRVVIEYHAFEGRDPADLVKRLQSLDFSLVHQKSAAPGFGTFWFSRRSAARS